MGKISDKSIPLYNILGQIPKDMPFELIENIASWTMRHKSPYSHSYYDAPVGWGYKPPDSLRISDHWNFTSQSKMHCETTIPVPDNTHYTIARFNDTYKQYVPIKSYLKLTTNVKDTLDYKLLWSDIKRLRAVNNLTRELEHNRHADYYLATLELTHAENVIDLFESFIK